MPSSTLSRRTSDHHLKATHRIETGSGLIKKNDFRIVDEGRREIEAALHAAGIGSNHSAQEIAQID